MNFNEISGKNVTYDAIKSDKKQSLTLSSDSLIFENIFLRFRCGFFLNETSILVFAELAIFHSI